MLAERVQPLAVKTRQWAVAAARRTAERGVGKISDGAAGAGPLKAASIVQGIETDTQDVGALDLIGLAIKILGALPRISSAIPTTLNRARKLNESKYIKFTQICAPLSRSVRLLKYAMNHRGRYFSVS